MPICVANVAKSANTTVGGRRSCSAVSGQGLFSEDAGVAILELSVFSLTAGF